MKFLSVCSGIEAASVAWGPLGWEAMGFAEIEPFPSALLAHHYPAVPNHGDMTQLADQIRAGLIDAPDILCGGTPCQAFSVAGLRKSLDDARGNLSLVFCELANAIDESRADPAIIFWENVPGVLSTKDNAFGCFLAGLAGEDDPLVPPGGKWTNAGCVLGPQRAVAWRVLDAQYFGVAQRRRRVFVVASARTDFDPAAVLFEWDGVRRDSAPSREAREAVAPTIRSGAPNGSPSGVENSTTTAVMQPVGIFQDSEFGVAQYDSAGTLRAGRIPEHQMVMQPVTQPYTLAIRGRGDTHQLEYRQDGTANALLTPNGGRGGIGVGAIAAPVAIRPDATPKWQDDLAFTLTQPSPTGGGQPQAIAFHPTQDPISSSDGSTHAMGCGSKGGAATVAVALQDVRAMSKAQNGRGWNADGTAYTVDTHATQGVAVAFPIDTQNMTEGHASGGLGFGQATDPSFTLTKGHSHAVATAMQVRRLTPVECERLQGFPDNYTAIPWRKKPASECPDGPRYKALGNSWAVPVVRWIGQRIQYATWGLL